MTRILLSHPHAAAFAQGAALGLERAGLLARFVTGVAAADGTVDAAILKLLGRRWRKLDNRLISGLAANHLRARWTAELVARFIGRSGLAFRDGGHLSSYNAHFALHDLLVALSTWPNDVDAVYAYEDAALRTFERARARGMRRIWDLPIPHYLTLERMWRQEWARWPEAAGASPRIEPPWKRRRKDRELELASEVVVASSFTKASLEEHDIRVPVHIIPYGFPVERFRPKTKVPDGPFTVLAVGSHDLRKGTPYLLEAWRKAGLRGARLRLIGPMRLSPNFPALRAEGIQHVSHLPRNALESEYQAADVLVLATLGDGFGMVIQEAMCAATPVITTRCGGGPECISDGVEGRIVAERSVDELAESLREAAADRDRLAAMGRAARARAEAWTWKEAGARLQAVLAPVAGNQSVGRSTPRRVRDAARSRRRIAVVTSHPIQYHAPWFRGLAELSELRVFFAHRQSAHDQAAAGYGVAFDWDTDLTGGFEHEFLLNQARAPNVYRFTGCDTPEIGERLREGNYDAVIVTGWYLKSYWQTVLACRRAGMPVLARGDSQLGTPRSVAKRLAKEVAYPLALRQFDGFLSVGQRHREYLRHFGVPNDRIAFVPHFVDDQLFRSRSRISPAERAAMRQQIGVRDGAAVALFVGRLIDIKRPCDLVRAVADLERQGQRFHALFVGTGPLEETLRAAAAAVRAPVSLLGFKNQTELAKVYGVADILVLPSSSETWGLVVNEAMCCGLPAVVSDAVGCAPDLIDPGKTGAVYRTGDTTALADAMQATWQLCGTEALTSALRAKTEEFSCARAVQATLDAVEAVLAGKAQDAH